MKKYELAKQLGDTHSLETSKCVELIDQFMELVMEAVSNGEKVTLRGFGCFSSKERKSKKGRDISRAKIIIVPARKMPHFKPYDNFIDKLD